MENMTDTKKIISLLKQVKDEKKLSLDAILALMEKNGDFVSKSTLSRIFREGSEETGFKYETTIRPIADAILDIDNIEVYDDTDTKAYKSLLQLKKEIISELKSANDQTKIKYAEKLQEKTDQFQRSMDFVTHQIELKDQRIDALLSMNNELMMRNNELLKQLMNCPLRENER